MTATVLTAIAVAVGGLLVQRRRGGVAALLALLAVCAFAATALSPVRVGHVEVEPRVRAVEVATSAGMTPVMAAAAGAGSRARDLTLQMVAPRTALPAGPLGGAGVLTRAPLEFDPERIVATVARRPAVGRPLAITITGGELAPPLQADVVVRDAAGQVLAETIELRPGEPSELALTPETAGRFTVEIRLATAAAGVVRSGAFEVEAAPRVLVLEPSGVVAAALTAQGLAVERDVAAAVDLSNYAAVVVGAPLTLAMQQSLAAAVLDGLGVFVLQPAFGGSGEPLHRLLPLRPDPLRQPGGALPGAAPSAAPPPPAPPVADQPPDGRVEDPGPVSAEPVEVDKRAIAMVLVVDRSGSMGHRLPNGRTPMSYAKTSALETARALTEGDQVGIVTFGNKGAGRVELEMTDALQATQVRAGVEKLAHGMEFTYLLSGLKQADRLLRPVRAAVKHVVVISDGEFDTSESVALRALANKMAQQGHMSVTILAIVSGRGSSLFMRYAEEIATDGGGQFLAIQAAEQVPVFVSAEVTRSLDRVGRKPRGGGDGPEQPSPRPDEPPDPPPEEPPPPEPDPAPEPPAAIAVRAVANSPVLAPLPEDGWPTLGQAASGTAPLDAQVLLVAGDDGWPLLAFGNRGLGRVGAFAADLCGEAGVTFRAEAAFPARLALWVQHVMRADAAAAPREVAMVTAIEPRVAVPAEVAELERLGGEAPARAAPEPLLAVRREVDSLVPDWALGALALLLLLGLAERVAAMRGTA